MSVTRAILLCAMLSTVAHADTETPAQGATSAPSAAKPDDDDGTPKLSLPTEADRVAWTTPGFRLGLGLAYGRMVGLGGAPSGRLLGPQLHVGLRLDESWSISSSFQYSSVSETGGLSGLRFAGTIDPTWHVTPSFSLAVGFGFGGVVEGLTDRMPPSPPPSSNTTYTYPDARTPVASCSGVGAAGLARAEWMYVLGPRSSTTVALELIGQYTACVQSKGLDPDTARPIEIRQFWPHTGVTLSWGVVWR